MMRISVQVELEIDVEPAATPSAFVRGLSGTVAQMLRGDEVLLLVSGDDYILSPQRVDEPNLGAGVRVHRADICMYGSPSVPGGGFLCGWC